MFGLRKLKRACLSHWGLQMPLLCEHYKPRGFFQVSSPFTFSLISLFQPCIVKFLYIWQIKNE